MTAYGASAENAEGGYFAQPVPLPAHPGATLYAKAGDWLFGIPCASLLCGVAGWRLRRRVQRTDVTR